MEIITHHSQDLKTAEIIGDELLIVNPEDTLQLIVDIYYQGFDRIVIHEKNITSDFFDLKTKLAGEILQKFINYKMSLIKKIVKLHASEKYSKPISKHLKMNSNRL